MDISSLQVAVQEMAREIAELRRRKLERQRTTALIRRIDGMLGELELLNLRDVAVVPAGWEERLALLVSSLPFEYDLALHAGPWSPTELLDALFDLQGCLFELRNGLPPESEQETRAS
jgi:hypothetical protein